MANNQEQIESRLCAYLEGELDPEGQVEIEKHLAANPSHRKLLEEVGRTRQFLRALPREAAPADLCEAFTGQLERAVLLDDSAEEEARLARMRIRRWPQYLAVAAVLMIAAGLGSLVYFGLPSGVDRTPYAAGTGTTQSAGARGDSDALHEDGEIERSAAVPQLESSTSTTGPGPRPDGGEAMTRGSEAETAKKQNDSLDMARGPQATEELTAVAGNGPPTEPLAYGTAGKPFYLVITADEPDQTRRQIAQHLERFNATWEAVPGDGEEAARLRTLALGTNVRAEAAVRRTTDLSLAKAKESEQLNEARGRGVGLKDGYGANVADPSPGAAAAPAAPAAPAQQPAPQKGRSLDTSADAPADTAVAERDANHFAREKELPQKELKGGGTRYAYARDGAAAAGGAPGAGGNLGDALRDTDELIVARGLTVQQAETLRAAFGRAEGERQTKLVAAVPMEPVAQQSRRKAVGNQTPTGATDVGGVEADADKMTKAQAGAVAEAPQGQSEAATLPAPLARAETRGGYGGFAGVGGGGGGGRSDRGAGARTDAAAARPSDRGYRSGGSPAGGATAPAPAPARDGNGDTIQALDSLHVVLADEKGAQVTRNVRVDEKGNVALPGVESFNCAGMTVSQLQDRLAAAADTSGNSASRLRPVEVKKVVEQPALADATKPNEVEGALGRGMQRSRAARTPAPPAASAPNSQVKLRTAQREAPDEQNLLAERTNTPAEAAEPKQEFAERETTSASPDGSAAATTGEDGAVAKLDAATRPTPAPAATSPLATAPASAPAEGGVDEAGAGEKVDVVIVLRRNAAPAPAATSAPAPVIAAGDALNVAFGEGYENTTAVTVRDDGTIELESLGTVKVAGSTTDDAARDIEALLKDKGLPADTKVTVTRTAQGPKQDAAAAPVPDPQSQQDTPDNQ